MKKEYMAPSVEMQRFETQDEVTSEVSAIFPGDDVEDWY